ncbi:MAG: 23S rRNA (uracil(1939)-C(5))-methyltransferase RlmD [Bacteroidales bacterium]|nr:23S rRNA (uracil(1939)-C(5))-methyltransferase RlmD [Lentimicrobiaceae bacterium]MDD5693871.1 23S rRNA (uracil(1939)-C(5))-methyltransferase RlmD [Bacteroidales bacterium]
MRRKEKKTLPLIEKVEITDAGSEGKAVARSGDLVIFIPFGAPGDLVDVQLTALKKSFGEGRIVRYHHRSEKRQDPFCPHFGLCGGCKWQHLKYSEQLFFKQKQVEDHFTRIGKLDVTDISPILPSTRTLHYRNKLEFTFSNRRWLTDQGSPDAGDHTRDMRALGFHLPGMFDRVLDIRECRLQEDPSNAIRMAVKAFAIEQDLPFYDVKKGTGLLRNLIIRNTLQGEWMVIPVFRYLDESVVEALLDHLARNFPWLTSLMYVINEKRNDTITDQKIYLYRGAPYLVETMPAYGTGKILRFKVGPVSFFQTNTLQAVELYRIAASFASPDEGDLVYDLYTGTGTIACYIAGKARLVVGIDNVGPAIDDAVENARFNQIPNTRFFCGDIAGVLNDTFLEANGSPDIVITDPPRAGMHEKVIRQLLAILPHKIVYISCNPATQARDLSLMQDHYRISRIQPVDMFPHTQHVENVVLLIRKDSQPGTE